MSIELNIKKDLENTLLSFLKPYEKDYIEQKLSFESDSYEGVFEIYANYKNEFNETKLDKCIFLRVNICCEWEQLHVPNIFLPHFMHYQGIGKKMILKVLEVANRYNYELFIITMVESFYQRMLKRGAIPTDNQYDAVQIVKETRLT